MKVTTAARRGFDAGLPPSKNMQESPTPLSVLGPQADAERQRIRQQFEAGASARDTLHALCELADNNVRQIFGDVLRVQSREPEGLCLLALGGYGRRMLFPYSDLDILFLFGSDKMEQEFRPLISEFSRTLWDLGFRVSSAGLWRCWTAGSWRGIPHYLQNWTKRCFRDRKSRRGPFCWRNCTGSPGTA